MRVLIAPDSFKGSLGAAAAAAALAEGWLSVRPGDQVTRLPLADGGEGTLDVLAATVPGARWRRAKLLPALAVPRSPPAGWNCPAGKMGRPVDHPRPVGRSALPCEERGAGVTWPRTELRVQVAHRPPCAGSGRHGRRGIGAG